MSEPVAADRVAIAWASAAVALSLAPLLPELGLGVALLSLVPLLWQLARLRQRPPRNAALPVLLLVAAGSFAVTFAHFGTVFGRMPGLALLATLVGLKLVESRSRRDLHVTVQLCFFLQLGYFLVAQTALTAVLALLGCAVALASLLRVENPKTGFRIALKGSGRLLLIAFPLVLILFLLFPRIERPLWGLPSDAYAGTTGLSDQMSPGSISDLSLSSAIAFRAEFEGAIPSPAQRYFRGPVLSLFDGRTWKAAPGVVSSPPQTRSDDPVVRYAVTMEPHQQRWLLALEHAIPGVDQTLDRDAVLRASEPVRNRMRVNLASSPGDALPEEDGPRIAQALMLPAGSNPRTQALGRELRASHPEAAERVAAALKMLREGDFVYTLAPPLLGVHAADGFLFDTRSGFCEHFASAFVVLMRAAGVPARVVTGYQGGEVNPVDGTLVVRQSDAHAWSEVWLHGRGWLRVDPTAIAAPRRIEGGIASALPEGDPVPTLARIDTAWLRGIRNQLEAASHAWNTWVLGYNAQRQRDLIARLGFPDPDWHVLAAILVSLAALWQGSVWILGYRERPKQSPAQAAWQRLLRFLSKRGFTPLAGEGPMAFSMRVGSARPEWSLPLNLLARRYARLHYGPPDSASDAAPQLDQAIRKWISENQSSSS